MSRKKPIAKLTEMQGPKRIALSDLAIRWGRIDDSPNNTVTGHQLARLLDHLRHTDFDPSVSDGGNGFRSHQPDGPAATIWNRPCATTTG
jgi:hypothetical protein